MGTSFRLTWSSFWDMADDGGEIEVGCQGNTDGALVPDFGQRTTASLIVKVIGEPAFCPKHAPLLAPLCPREIETRTPGRCLIDPGANARP